MWRQCTLGFVCVVLTKWVNVDDMVGSGRRYHALLWNLNVWKRSLNEPSQCMATSDRDPERRFVNQTPTLHINRSQLSWRDLHYNWFVFRSSCRLHSPKWSVNCQGFWGKPFNILHLRSSDRCLHAVFCWKLVSTSNVRELRGLI